MTPPPLPEFIARQLPFHRAVHTLREGPDAGRHLHFIDQGDRAAQPVLMVHGSPAWSYLWRKVIALLPGYRCVAPDLLGFGLSDRLPRIADHSLDRHGRAIADLVAALDLRDIILAGQDWGGPIALQVGLRHPDRIAGVVLGNTAVTVPSRPRGTWFHKLSHAPLVSDLLFRGLGFPMMALSRLQGDPASIRGEVAKAYRWPLRTWKDRVAPLATARMVPNSPEHPSVEALRKGEAWIRSFTGPMEVVWGSRDPLLGRGLRHLESAFPQARVTRTEAGHFLQEEVPEALAAAVSRIQRTR